MKTIGETMIRKRSGDDVEITYKTCEKLTYFMPLTRNGLQNHQKTITFTVKRVGENGSAENRIKPKED